MRAPAETTGLPFPDGRYHHVARQGSYEVSQDRFLALRHARVPFHPNDRLLLLYGHPLVFRVGLYAATERVLAGEPVLYLDGANTFDPFVVGRLARAHHKHPRKILTMIHVARAFTCHQMARLVSDCLASALDRYQARLAVLSGLLDTFYDGAVPEQEAWRLFSRMMEAISRLTWQGYTLLCLCPPAPVPTRTSRRCLERLRRQADRVIRVVENQGLVRLEEEGDEPGRSWETTHSVLGRSLNQ
jgi:hypothetical protein